MKRRTTPRRRDFDFRLEIAEFADDDGGWYFSFFGGTNNLEDQQQIFVDNTDDRDTAAVDYDAEVGGIVGGAVGYELQKTAMGQLRAEVELSYRNNN